jgi:hypothetical protein
LGKAKTRQNLKIAREANLRLAVRKVFLGELKNGSNWPQTHWAAVQAAHEKVGKISESLVLVSLYNKVRTYFENNF